MTTVLVTGAGGFVGSAAVRALVESEARFWDGDPVEHVIALVRPRGSEAPLRDLAPSARWSLERADLGDPRPLESIFEQFRPRAVVHAALDRRAYEHVDDSLVRRPLEASLEGLGNVGMAPRFLHVGSAWVLRPGTRLDEAAPVDPGTPYALNKAREDALLPEIADANEVPWINLRLFNLFGRYEKPGRLLPTLVSRLSNHQPVDLTHGDQIRDFNDVDVVGRAFVDALAAPDSACGAVYHIGSGIGTSVRQLTRIVSDELGHDDMIRFGTSETDDAHLPALVADPSRAGSVLGWQPDLDLPARVRAAVAWWQERVDPSAAREVVA